MTFEEYRKTFENFSKIDTPEKLAICEQQYRSYIRALESNNFFEPLEEKLDENDIISKYTNNLYSILNFKRITPGQVLFLIQPSFEPESLLKIEKLDDSYTLIRLALEENYWYRFYRNNSVSTARMKQTRANFPKDIGDKLFILIDQCMNEAKKPDSGFWVLDGVKYKLSKIIGERRMDIFKHSPDENSKTGKIIKLLETVAEFTDDNPTIERDKAIESLWKLMQ